MNESQLINRYGKGSKEHLLYEIIMHECHLVDTYGESSNEVAEHQNLMRRVGINPDEYPTTPMPSAPAKKPEPEPEYVTVCGECGGEVHEVSSGDEGVSVCSECQTIEGPTEEITLDEFEARSEAPPKRLGVNAWLEIAKQAVEKNSAAKWPTCEPNWQTLSWTQGKKYIRVTVSHPSGQAGSAFCFIDQDGNIYKPASYNVPAKGVRGTIHNVDPNKLDGSTGWLYRR